jgi:alkylglycerol monooxygenase
MEQYGKILLFAMPAFFVLVLFEKWYGWRKGQDTVRTMDMISSLSSGITNVTKDILGISVAIISYEWMLKHLAITSVQHTWLTYVIAFIVLDFAGYIVHYIDHKVNFFWNAHIVHHSSEEFNLACALRQSISVFVKLFVILLLPAALLGVPAQVIITVAPIHLFAQFWYHTRHINKMGFLEHIIVTPSHHRVHHAINKEYLDKNLGQIFIVWDKLFGTFQPELKNIPPVYGITRPVQTWNPIKINFQHLWLLVKDAWRTRNFVDKLTIWFKPTGWRPADVTEKFPVHKIDDVYNFKKFTGIETTTLKVWCWMQLTILLLLLAYMFGNIGFIGVSYIFIYGLFVFLYVYAMTELMDGNKNAVIWEAIKCVAGIAIIFYFKGWFGIDKIATSINYALLFYFAASTFVVYAIQQQQKALANVAST